MTRVSAGIIRRADGRVLICRRGAGRQNAHLWEFPGGKREAGEDAAACLGRELREELALDVTGIRPALSEEKQGLVFDFLCCEAAGEPEPQEHEAVAWVRPREMLRYRFCPADADAARRLALNDPPLTAFFWDFDGTLMDTYPAMVRVFLQAAGRLGLAMGAERALALMMNNLGHCIRTVAAESGVSAGDLAAAYDEEAKGIRLDEVKPMPGIPEALRALKAKGGRHYLATHRNGQAWDFLREAGLAELFDGGVTSEDRLPRKPEPDMLLCLLARHGIDARQAVIIGDRPLDTAAGRRAGMLSCMMDTSGRFAEDAAEMYCRDAWALPTLLRPEGLQL